MLVPDSVLEKLHSATNKMAEEVKLIREKMTGKGISPVEAPLTQARLQEIENKLRMIAGDKDNIVPFN